MFRVHGHEGDADHHQIDHKRGRRHDQGNGGAFSNSNDVERGQDADTGTGEEDDVVIENGKDAADVLKTGNCGDGGGKKIIDGNQHAAQATPHRPESLRGDRNHAAAFGIAPSNFYVFEGERDETAGGEQDEKRRCVFDVAVEDAGNVIDRSADVTENDGPCQEPSKLARVSRRSHLVGALR